MKPFIDRDNPQKLYLQLYEILKDSIERGDWPVDAQIPTEKELCEEHNVSKATVRLAISELVRQGYIRRQQGKGTFVCKRDIPEGISMLTSFKEHLFEEGVNFSTRVLAQTVLMPINGIDTKLDISEQRHVLYIKRLRLLDNEPLLLQETYIPHYICPMLLGEDTATNSLIDLIEKKCNKRITVVHDYIDIAYPKAQEASLLSIDENSPCLLIEQIFFSGIYRVCYSRSLKRQDRLKFFIELKRSL